jgi:hypothetical protein
MDWHDEWDGRRYRIGPVSYAEGPARELEDVGPDPARGVVMEVFHHSYSSEGALAMAVFTEERLPLELVEAFISAARRSLSGS